MLFLFILFIMSFVQQKFLILMMFNILTFLFFILYKKFLTSLGPKDILYFLLKFLSLPFLFDAYELNFDYGMR